MAFFVDRLPSLEVARRFGYSPGAFRVLCYQFRHDPHQRARFFAPVQHGPHAAPARDRVRELVIAMRKRNLSVYDLQRESPPLVIPLASMPSRSCSANKASPAYPDAWMRNDLRSGDPRFKRSPTSAPSTSNHVPFGRG